MGNCCTSLESINSNYEDLLNDFFEKLPIKNTSLETVIQELDNLGVSDKFCLDKLENKEKTKEELKAEKELQNKIKIQNNRDKQMSNVDTPVGKDQEKDEVIFDQVFDEFISNDTKFLTITNFHKFIYKYCLIENSNNNHVLLNFFSEWYKLFPNKFKLVGFKIIFGLLSKQPSSKNSSEIQNLFYTPDHSDDKKVIKQKENVNKNKHLAKNDMSILSYNESVHENNLIEHNTKNIFTDDPVIEGYLFNNEFNKYIFYIKELTTYKLKTESIESINNLKVSHDKKVKLRYIKNSLLFDILFIYIKGLTNLTLNHFTQPLLDKRYNLEVQEQYRKLWDDRVIIYFIKDKIFKKDFSGSSYIVIKDFIFHNLGLLTNESKLRRMLTDFSENEFCSIVSKDSGTGETLDFENNFNEKK